MPRSTLRVLLFPISKSKWVTFPLYIPRLDEKKLPSMLKKVQEAFHQARHQLEEAPEKSLLGRVRTVVHKLENQIDPREQWIRAIKSDRDLVFQYPSSLTLDRVRKEVDHFLSQRQQYHLKYMIASTVLLPFTLLMGILPGPNVFFAWNAYRWWCHYGCWQGTRQYALVKTNENLIFNPCDHLERLFPPHLVLTNSHTKHKHHGTHDKHHHKHHEHDKHDKHREKDEEELEVEDYIEEIAKHFEQPSLPNYVQRLQHD
eukprot:TRINITY_DN5896_c0_g2_i10.p1 TRINITY_DN5896_c0_g2~~TRINITY_DN5896_c0_g2_i10.p1  ORF type:complete len:258 (-),score=43.92 TRINITY_DN5896_c0_g2_i10:276-1049(-)